MKHTVAEIRAEYNRLDALCGIDSSKIPIRISTKAVKRYGCCSWKRVNGYVTPKSITITDFILDCDEQFWDTIRHEYAHMLVIMRTHKSHGHDAVWKAACKEVGCSPNRLANDTQAHQMASDRRREMAKYSVRCKTCNRKWTYVRAGSVVKALRKGSICTCPCGSHDFELLTL